jgi:voltage-gated potassium channel
MLTLSLHCVGTGALIAWARNSLESDAHRLGPFRSAVLMVRLITAFIVLHILEILLWAGFYRWLCFPLWEAAFYFSTSSYGTVGYGDIVLPQTWFLTHLFSKTRLKRKDFQEIAPLGWAQETPGSNPGA